MPETVLPLGRPTGPHPDTAGPGDSRAWLAFAAPVSDAAFCDAWLKLLCARIPDVHAGLLLLRDARATAYVPAAYWPSHPRDLSYLSSAAERSLAEGRGVTLLSADSPDVAHDRVHVACPVTTGGEVGAAVVLDLSARPDDELQSVLRTLLWGAASIEAFLSRQRLAAQARQLARAGAAVDLVQQVNDQDGLTEAAMAVTNELTALVAADRVSLGMERGGAIKLVAISRTAWFDAKSQLVAALQAAMEESVDQDACIGHPAAPGSQGRVMSAQRELAQASGAASVLTLPLMARGKPVGALTLERDGGEPFDEASVTLCQAACEVLGPPLRRQLEGERWFAGRAARMLAKGRTVLVGPTHQALKLGGAVALAALLYVGFADAQFRVAGRTSIEGAVQRAAVAPFDGYIAEAAVRAGDVVREGALLAVIDDRDLRLERVKWQAERDQLASKFAEALAKRERAAMGIVAAQLEQAESQLAMAQDKLARTRLVAPFEGVVVSGDLSQMLGAPVEKGKVLFELAPLDQYRVVLRVDERDIRFVKAGQRGELALTGITGETLPFEVKTVTPVSTAQDGRNFFRVEAQLAQASQRLRPGMEGVGKIDIGERGLAWIWTRSFFDWARLALWNWTP